MGFVGLVGTALDLVGRDVAFGGTAVVCSTLSGSDAVPAALPVLNAAQAANAAFVGTQHAAGGCGIALPKPMFGQSDEMGATAHKPQAAPASLAQTADTIAPDVGEAPVAEADAAHGRTGQPALSLARGGLSLSGGYSTLERFRIKAEISRTFASGRQIAASASYSSLRMLAEVGVSGPFAADARTVLAARIFAERQRGLGFAEKYTDAPFERRLAGAELAVRRTLSAHWSLGGSARFMREDFRMTVRRSCDPSTQGGIVCSEIGKGNRADMTVTVTYDGRDNRISPHRGVRFRLAQGMVAWRGGFQYLKSEALIERFVPFGDEWTVATSLEGGAITRVGSKGAPLFDRFYLGGQSLHGFDLRGLSPRLVPGGVTTAAPVPVPVGGDYYYVARAELIGRTGGVLGREDFRPSLFVEAGSAFSVDRRRLLPGETLAADHAAPRLAIGAGLRWTTPAGHLRLAVALPVLSRTGDRRQIVSLSFGA